MASTDSARSLLILLPILASPGVCLAQLPAFPGADGAGASASGGRGGIVYHVTKLNSAIDDPERAVFGTLRWGLTSGNFPTGVPRTIVFDAGGVFDLGHAPFPADPNWDANGNGWDPQSRLTIGGTNVTLAGQTAPGAGVIFMGGGLKPQGNNNIIRNITVASGYGMHNWWDPGEPFPEQPPAEVPPEDRGVGILPDATVYDGMDISGTNLIIDHVSTLYSTDEAISMNEVADNITVQYSNISQGQNYPQWDPDSSTPHYTGHALGSLLSAAANSAISFHHNLYAHQKSRLPQLAVGKDQATGGYYDFRNNVFYNWFGTAGAKSGSTRLNLVGNFYLTGEGGDDPNGGTNTGISHENGGTGVLGGSGTVYREGNLRDINRDGDPDDGSLVSGGAASPLWSGGVATYAGTTDSARDAFDRVLDYVGANWWTRDGVVDTPDERIINEARTGTGKVVAWADDPWNDDPTEGVEWRALKNTPQASRAADWDTEPSVGYGVGDGMPTYWELEHGLDPNARDDAGDFDSDGYTNLEEYLNEIAAWPAPNAIAFNNAHGDGRFAHILNWDANPDAASVHPWQPSRYDTAIVDNGTVVVDSVGQHAGNLLLATGSDDDATLNITAGWLLVEDAPHGMSDGITVIGDNNAATAELNLMGGKLTTKTLLKGDGGTFNFTGGVLSAETIGFDLVNDGGTIAPGYSPGLTHVMGDLILNDGVLEIEIGGTEFGQYDRVEVDGIAMLGGLLKVELVELEEGEGQYVPQLGDQFAFLAVQGGAGDVFGEFDLPSLSPGLGWALNPGDVTLFLEVVAVVGLPGDYNGDGTVNAADYTVWRDMMGQTGPNLAADGTGPFLTPDGVVDELDYQFWVDNFGNTLGSSLLSNATVPEPSTIFDFVILLVVAARAVRRV